ncbi:MAG: glycosyltransferase family 4 protein [Deltaproteobacteria bacterium]|nr:glycosyltransferase family 4 protein [Deltaproteobacteria bacterium]
MKILYALHKFLPRYFSGTEMYTYNLAKELQKRGHQVQIFCAEDVEKGQGHRVSAYDDPYDGLEVHRITFNRKKAPDIIRSSYDNPVVAEHFTSFVSSWKPDVVHITSFLNLSAAIIEPLKAHGIPSVFTATDFWSFCPKSTFLSYDFSLCTNPEPMKCLSCIISLSPFYTTFLRNIRVSPLLVAQTFSLLSRLPVAQNNSYIKGRRALEDRPAYILGMLKNLDLIITPTPFLNKFFLDAGFSSEKVLVSEFGLAATRPKPDRSPSVQPLLRFGYIGILAHLKGVDILIRSFLQAATPDQAVLKIYGDDSHFPTYANQLKRMAEKAPNIFFGGTFPPERLGEILSEIDVLIVPSIWYENTPLVLLSALAAGVPVIASDVPGITHVVHDGLNGLLFSRGSIESLTRRLDQVLQEPPLIQRLGETVTPIKSIADNGQELEEHYRSLVQKNCGQPESGRKLTQTFI